MTRREGFTLVELAVVVLIVALLAVIATPNFQRALLKARAAEAVSELHVIRVAVLNYVGDRHTYPPDRNRGQIPPGLAEYLPANFSFVRPGYTIDYDEWSGSRGFVGLTIITQDRLLGQAMVDMLGTNTWSDGNQKFTWVVEWTR